MKPNPLIPHPAVEQIRTAYAKAIAKHRAAIAKLEAEQQEALEGVCATVGNGHLWMDDHPQYPLGRICLNCARYEPFA